MKLEKQNYINITKKSSAQQPPFEWSHFRSLPYMTQGSTIVATCLCKDCHCKEWSILPDIYCQFTGMSFQKAVHVCSLIPSYFYQMRIDSFVSSKFLNQFSRGLWPLESDIRSQSSWAFTDQSKTDMLFVSVLFQVRHLFSVSSSYHHHHQLIIRPSGNHKIIPSSLSLSSSSPSSSSDHHYIHLIRWFYR